MSGRKVSIHIPRRHSLARATCLYCVSQYKHVAQASELAAGMVRAIHRLDVARSSAPLTHRASRQVDERLCRCGW